MLSLTPCLPFGQRIVRARVAPGPSVSVRLSSRLKSAFKDNYDVQQPLSGGGEPPVGNGGGSGGGGGDGEGDDGRSGVVALLAGRAIESLPAELASALEAGLLPAEMLKRYLALEKNVFLAWLLQFGCAYVRHAWTS
jgi:hypothetical protein